MDKKWCDMYKEWKIWEPELCKYCVARKCEDRKLSYYLAGPREKSRKVGLWGKVVVQG